MLSYVKVLPQKLHHELPIDPISQGIVVPSYFYSEWSLAQFRLPEDCWSVVGFGQEVNTLYVLNQKGSFYKVEFDPIKGKTVLRCLLME